MEEFLRLENVDIAREFPRGTKYKDSDGNAIARSEALKNKCVELQQAFIDARNAGTRTAPKDWVWNGSRGKALSVAVPAAQELPAIEAGSDSSAEKTGRTPKPALFKTVGNETAIVSQLRKDLRKLHGQTANKLCKSYLVGFLDSTVDDAAPTRPIISATVDQLVFDTVKCQLQFEIIRFRIVHGTKDSTDDNHILRELHNYRAKLVTELQRIIQGEKGLDPVLVATQVVLQEFPADF